MAEIVRRAKPLALEQPEILVSEIRTGLRTLRS
jgi:hypothetical protein